MSYALDTLSYALLSSIVGAAALLSIRNSKAPDIHPLLLNTQSDVSRLRHPGESAVYRSRMYPMGTPLCSTFDRGIRTLADFYKAGGIEKNSSAEFLQEKSSSGYDWATYGSIGKRLTPVYQGLRSFGKLVPQTGDESSFVGIYATNSLYTVLTEFACHSNGLATVPISAHATTSHTSHVIQKTGLKLLVTDAALLGNVLAIAGSGCSLKYVVVIGDVSSEQKNQASEANIELISFTELESQVPKEQYEPVVVAPSDICSIYFTKESKTGVVLTQKNLLSTISSYLLIVPPPQRFSSKDRLFLNLPIDNVFGHILVSVLSVLGGSIVFSQDVNESGSVDIASALAVIAEAKPTIFVSESSFLSQVKSWISSRYGNSFLFKRGYDIKQGYLAEGRLINDCKYDMLVFRDIRQSLFGGNLRLIYIDNDDNVDPELADFLRVVLSTQVLQTFNLTETGSSVTASMFYDYNADKSGKGAPLPCNEVKLVDLPELSYTAEDKPNPRGEIWVRGNNVFKEYYKDENATSQVLDTDGWFTTGLVGEVMANGSFKVIAKK